MAHLFAWAAFFRLLFAGYGNLISANQGGFFMKRWFLAAVYGVIIFSAMQSGWAQTNTVLGTWRVDITGRDKGIAYLTFTNDLTMTGWGIKLRSAGPFTMAGTWDLDSNGDVVCGYTEAAAGGAASGHFVGHFKSHGRLLIKTDATNGRFNFSSDNGLAFPDLHGTWIGNVIKGGFSNFETFIIAASTNEPNLFTLSGNGLGPEGAYSVTGAILVDSHQRAYGYDIEQIEDGGSVTNSFGGRLNKRADSADFKGVDDKGHSLRIKITRQ